MTSENFDNESKSSTQQHRQSGPNGRNTESPERNLNAERMFYLIIDTLIRIWLHIKAFTNRLMHEYGIYSAIDKIARLSARHPFLALCVSIGVFITLLPIIILAGFAVTAIVVMFTGFILLEGTFLTIISALIFGCLGALLLGLMFFGTILAAGYFGFSHIFDLFCENKATLTKFVWQEKCEKNTMKNINGTGNQKKSNQNKISSTCSNEPERVET